MGRRLVRSGITASYNYYCCMFSRVIFVYKCLYMPSPSCRNLLSKSSFTVQLSVQGSTTIDRSDLVHLM
ncbi:hypothetical protein RB195_022852 [Necator americanus]|uniref:Uncharacterized protein n=1 Tax=Necator americanus TaxID=51031 RepID=A0ABR1EGU4_NECAM